MLELDGTRVRSYAEKPRLAHDVSLGIYALDPRALERLPEGPVDVPDLVATLLAGGDQVHAYRFDGAWFDIGTLPDHERALTDFGHRPEHYLGRRDGEPSGT